MTKHLTRRCVVAAATATIAIAAALFASPAPSPAAGATADAVAPTFIYVGYQYPSDIGEIGRLELRTGTVTDLFSIGEAFHPGMLAVSPSGKLLAFMNDRSWVGEGTEVDVWTVKPSVGSNFYIYGDLGAVMSPSWSADGMKLFVGYVIDGTASVWAYSFVTAQFARQPALLPPGTLRSFSFSPAGTQIIYSVDIGGQRQMVRTKANGTPLPFYNDPRIMSSKCTQPDYAPDGLTFAVACNTKVYRVSADGYTLTTVLSKAGAVMQYARISSDNRYIAVVDHALTAKATVVVADTKTGTSRTYAVPYASSVDWPR